MGTSFNSKIPNDKLVFSLDAGNSSCANSDSFSGARTGTGGSVSEIYYDGVVHRVHSFSAVGDSTFNLGQDTDVEYLVVAGGGGGGGGNPGGGGGGGGVVTNENGDLLRVNGSTNYTITVGDGGAGGSPVVSFNGEDSSALGIVAKGGGGGGCLQPDRDLYQFGSSGGSGGGATAYGGDVNYFQDVTGGEGYPGQGFPGGAAFADTGSFYAAAGGGGAGSSGTNGGRNGFSTGGFGRKTTFVTGEEYYYGGGGGGGRFPTQTQSTGGLGGGGLGGNSAVVGGNGVDGQGGGGGGGNPTGGDGGSGFVGIRYKRYGQVNDLINPERNLEVLGGTSFDSNLGGSFSFNGSDAYLSKRDTGIEDSLNINGPVSIFAWIKQPTASGIQYIVTKNNSGGTADMQFMLGIDGGIPQFSIGGVTGNGGSSVSSNVWSFIGVSWDGSQTVNSYKNGNLVKQSTINPSLVNMSQKPNFAVGARNPGAFYFLGNISQVFVYSRNLVEDEVYDFYKNTKTRYGL